MPKVNPNDWDELDDLPTRERVRPTSKDRPQGALTNLFVYGTNRRNGAKRRLEKLARKNKEFKENA